MGCIISHLIIKRNINNSQDKQNKIKIYKFGEKRAKLKIKHFKKILTNKQV